jgi:hypothetical protein
VAFAALVWRGGLGFRRFRRRRLPASWPWRGLARRPEAPTLGGLGAGAGAGFAAASAFTAGALAPRPFRLVEPGRSSARISSCWLVYQPVGVVGIFLEVGGRIFPADQAHVGREAWCGPGRRPGPARGRSLSRRRHGRSCSDPCRGQARSASTWPLSCTMVAYIASWRAGGHGVQTPNLKPVFHILPALVSGLEVQGHVEEGEDRRELGLAAGVGRRGGGEQHQAIGVAGLGDLLGDQSAHRVAEDDRLLPSSLARAGPGRSSRRHSRPGSGRPGPPGGHPPYAGRRMVGATTR